MPLVELPGGSDGMVNVNRAISHAVKDLTFRLIDHPFISKSPCTRLTINIIASDR